MTISEMAASVDATPVNPTILSDSMVKEWANMLGEPDQGTNWIERARAASPSEHAEAAEKRRRAVSVKMKTTTDGRGKEWKMPTAASVAEERAQKAPKGDPVEMAAKKAQPKTKPAPAKKSTEKRTAAPKPASKPKAIAKAPAVKTADGSLTCRYCGEPVTQPSFIKRRDARCGKCFAERYGKKKVQKVAAPKEAVAS